MNYFARGRVFYPLISSEAGMLDGQIDPVEGILRFMGVIAAASVALYLYFAITILIIANKSNTRNGWLSFIPVANVFLLCAIGRRSYGWVFLMLLPIVNLIAAVVLYMSVAQARGKPGWVGALIFLPIIGLLVPLYLCFGPDTNPDETVADPAAGGQPRPVVARSSAGGLVLAGLAMLLLMAGATAAAGWFVFGREIAYTPPVREEPALPQRMAGTFQEFPVDTAPNPARPTSVIAQQFTSDEPGAGGTAGTGSVVGSTVDQVVNVPSNWLPPGIEASSLPALASGITSATYQTPGTDAPAVVSAPPTGASAPGSGNFGGGDPLAPEKPASTTGGLELNPPAPSGQAPGTDNFFANTGGTPAGDPSQVYVHTLQTPPDRPNVPSELAANVAQATGGVQTPISITSPQGVTYTGWQVQNQNTATYVLVRPQINICIVIYAAAPQAKQTARRLAGNVGNGRGLVDYPGFKSYLAALPAVQPDNLRLRSMQTFTPADFGLDPASLNAAARGSSRRGGVVTEEDRKFEALIGQVSQFIPERITTTRYTDETRADWHMAVCDYGSSRRAWNIWTLFRWTLGVSGMESVSVLNTQARHSVSGEFRVMIFQKGPYLTVITAPAAAPVERVVKAAGKLQL